MILPRDVSIAAEWTFFALTVGVGIGAVVTVVSAITSPQRRRRRLLVAVSLLFVWSLAAAWVRTHTGLGVLVLHGADHWVGAAAAEKDERRASTLLTQVIQSSNYGVNAAEAAALKLPADQQVRVFTLLVGVVPWENWKNTYRNHALAARSRGERPAV